MLACLHVPEPTLKGIRDKIQKYVQVMLRLDFILKQTRKK